MSAGTAGIIFVTFIAFLGGVTYFLFLRPRGTHTYMVREARSRLALGSHNSHRRDMATVPAESSVAGVPDAAPYTEDPTEIYYGWPSAVAYYADVARIDAYINSNRLGVAEWLPARYRRREGM